MPLFTFTRQIKVESILVYVCLSPPPRSCDSGEDPFQVPSLSVLAVDFENGQNVARNAYVCIN